MYLDRVSIEREVSMVRLKWIEKWRSYRYRFVPWIALNFQNRTVRVVSSKDQDKIVPDYKLLNSLVILLKELNCCSKSEYPVGRKSASPQSVMYNVLGYEINRLNSSIPGAGRGVFVTRGQVPGGSLVALYPGTLYWPHEPILIQSVGNPFLFRCVDGILIDGNDKGLSKLIYRSNARRDQIGPYRLCDDTWLGNNPQNPLAMGQYVNNRPKTVPANVAYQEFDIPFKSISPVLWKNLPNVWYNSGNIASENSFLRSVALVSLREIEKGEEVFSSYFTVIH